MCLTRQTCSHAVSRSLLRSCWLGVPADAQALIEEAINMCAMRFLDGGKEVHDRLFLRSADMQAVARMLQISAGELQP